MNGAVPDARSSDASVMFCKVLAKLSSSYITQRDRVFAPMDCSLGHPERFSNLIYLLELKFPQLHTIAEASVLPYWISIQHHG
jgi:hypothetical protein